MKIKTLIKRLTIILLIAIVFYGCSESTKEIEIKNVTMAKKFGVYWLTEDAYRSDYEEFTIIVIDSCEYLVAEHDRSRMITHKGNCKFCAARNKKLYNK